MLIKLIEVKDMNKAAFCTCCSCEEEHWERTHIWSHYEAERRGMERERDEELHKLSIVYKQVKGDKEP